jgi:hypothetical protein
VATHGLSLHQSHNGHPSIKAITDTVSRPYFTVHHSIKAITDITVSRLSRTSQYQGCHGHHSIKAITDITVSRLSRTSQIHQPINGHRSHQGHHGISHTSQCQGYHRHHSHQARYDYHGDITDSAVSWHNGYQSHQGSNLTPQIAVIKITMDITEFRVRIKSIMDISAITDTTDMTLRTFRSL